MIRVLRADDPTIRIGSKGPSAIACRETGPAAPRRNPRGDATMGG